MESLNCSSCRDRIIGRRWVLANGWVCSRPGELRRLGDEAGWVSGKTGTNRRKNDWPNLILGWWNSAPCNEFIGFSLLVCLFVFFMKILGVSKSLYDIYLGNLYRYPNPRLPHPNWWCSKGILPQKVHLIQVRNYKWRILICPASWWLTNIFVWCCRCCEQNLRIDFWKFTSIQPESIFLCIKERTKTEKGQTR